MADPFREQKVQNWAAEFSDQDSLQSFPPSMREYAREIASAFILSACSNRDVEPDQLTENDLKVGLLWGSARLALPPEGHDKAVDLCALFVEYLQKQGRMAGGQTLAPFVRALRSSYNVRNADRMTSVKGETSKGKTFIKPGSKLGLNDPCPCGSGLKYKKCCKRLLG